MKTIFHTLRLFVLDETISHCIVIPFPTNGVIVDKFAVGNEGYLIVESPFDSEIGTAHFHLIPSDKIVYTDSREYAGHFMIDIEGVKTLVLAIKIPEGDFGMYSADYIAERGMTKEPEVKPEEPITDFEPISAEEMYQLFNIDSPTKKKVKRQYKKRIKKENGD
jgi:diadenosine tetraphosphate (Ap4A) HIT family hydrolase